MEFKLSRCEARAVTSNVCQCDHLLQPCISKLLNSVRIALVKTGFSHIPIQTSSSTIYVIHHSAQHCQPSAVIPFHNITVETYYCLFYTYIPGSQFDFLWLVAVPPDLARRITNSRIPYSHASYTRALCGHHDSRVLLLSLIIQSMVVTMQNSLLQVV